MDVYHLLLGRPWSYARAIVHDWKHDTYSFVFDKVKFALLLTEVELKPLVRECKKLLSKKEIVPELMDSTVVFTVREW